MAIEEEKHFKNGYFFLKKIEKGAILADFYMSDFQQIQSTLFFLSSYTPEDCPGVGRETGGEDEKCRPEGSGMDVLI